MQSSIQIKSLPPTIQGFPIYLFQSPESRAINVGFIEKGKFIPGRLHYGIQRMLDTHIATTQSLQTPQIQKILKKYPSQKISTLVIMREAVACNVPLALFKAGIQDHYGDAFIGATHIKSKTGITAKYSYENTEGLVKDGLWIAVDSICMGRSFIPTLTSLFSKGFLPKEIIFICPICSRRGIETFTPLLKKHKIKATFLAWGALFGVGENLYDMPWGHKDTEVLDQRDYQTFIKMYGPNMCVGGDFGNYYFSPSLAEKLYKEQLKEHHISPKIPRVEEIRKIYHTSEILKRIA